MPIPTYSIYVPSSVLPAETVLSEKPASPFPIDDDMRLYTLVLLPVDQRPPSQRYGLFFVEDYDNRTDTWIMRPVVHRRNHAGSRRSHGAQTAAVQSESYALATRALGYGVGRVYAYSGPLTVSPQITTIHQNNGSKTPRLES